jgi:hypothetical protein
VPTADEKLGIAWWNGLSDTARVFWLEQASVGGRIWDISAADAWTAYKTIHGLESRAFRTNLCSCGHDGQVGPGHQTNCPQYRGPEPL